jgi:hypothetical protein
VGPQGTTNIGSFVSVACGVRYIEDTEEMHVCGVTRDGKLWYTSRTSGQDWQPFENLQTRIQGNWSTFQVQNVTFGLSFLDLCVIVLTNNGERRILRSSRHFDGSWENFQDVNDAQLAGFPRSFTSAGCTTISPELSLEELHLCGVTDDGKLYHTLRDFVDGSFYWLPFADVETRCKNGPGHFTNVSVAQSSPDLQGRQDLHVFAQAAGDLWHTVRISNPPRWQPTFDSIKQQAGNPGAFSASSCVNVGGQLHVCAVTTDGKLWHTTSSLEGPAGWQPFEAVATAGAALPGTFGFVSLAMILLPPGRGGDNTDCPSIRAAIGNYSLQAGMLGQMDANDPVQQKISDLQRLAQQKQCL